MTQRDLFEDLKDKVEDKLNDATKEVAKEAKSLWQNSGVKFMVAGFGVILICMITLTIMG